MREKPQVRKNIPYADFQANQRKSNLKNWDYQKTQNKFQNFDFPFELHSRSYGVTVDIDRIAAFLKLLTMLPIPKTIVLPIVLLILSTSVLADSPPDDQVTSCSTGHTPKVDIKALVNQRLVITSHTGLTQTKCRDKITKLMIKTTEQFPHHKPDIIRVLQDNRLKLVCTSQEGIYQKLKEEEKKGKVWNIPSYSAAFFDVNKKSINLPIKTEGKDSELSLAVMNHELMHADAYLRHSKTPCLRDDTTAIAPVHPFSRDNVEAYYKAFDQGDARMKEFIELDARDQKGKKQGKKLLSHREMQRLQTYKDACKDCFIDDIIKGSSEYESFVKNNIQEGDYIQMNNGLEDRLNLVKLLHDKKEVVLRCTNPISFILLEYSEKIEFIRWKYKDADPVTKIAEREAHTFEHLSESAIKTFYPEAYELRQMYISRCVPIEDRDNLHRPG